MSYVPLLAVALALCSPVLAKAQTSPPVPPFQQQHNFSDAGVPALGAARVLTWSSPPPDAINVHFVRTDRGVVLFDGLRRSDQVEELVAALELLGAEPTAILLTHAHSDHYGGVPFLRDRYGALPIYASEGVREEIREDNVPDGQDRRAMFGIRFPTQATLEEHLPTDLVTDGREVSVAGLRIVPYVMGASESAAAVVYHLPELNAAVVGDLVNVLTIAAPTLSLDEWLGQLDRLDALLPADATLYVGHGSSGPAGRLIADQRTYLELLRDLVTEAMADEQGVSAEETADIVRAIRLAYPHHRGAALLSPDALVEASVGWVAEQLVGEE